MYDSLSANRVTLNNINKDNIWLISYWFMVSDCFHNLRLFIPLSWWFFFQEIWMCIFHNFQRFSWYVQLEYFLLVYGKDQLINTSLFMAWVDLTSRGNPIVQIRRSYDRLISTLGFPLLERWHIYINSAHWWHKKPGVRLNVKMSS